MSAIAQRRVAGATAVMILLYLMQVALFAPPAQAAVSFVLNDDGPGSTCPSNEQSPGSNVVEEWGTAADAGGTVEVTVNAGYVVDICVKQGSGHQIWRVTYHSGSQIVAFDPALSSTQAAEGLSHWGWALVSGPQVPEFVIGACDDEGARAVSFVVPDSHLLALTWVDDEGVQHRVGGPGHAFYAGEHEIDLDPETYQWFLYYLYEVTPEGVEKIVEVGKDYFTVQPCETTTTTTAPTTTTTAPTTTTTAPTTTTTAPTTTTEDLEILGTTITTVPEVTADTLPFTGFESGDLVRLGLLALVGGVALLLVVARRPDDEPMQRGGWSAL